MSVRRTYLVRLLCRLDVRVNQLEYANSSVQRIELERISLVYRTLERNGYIYIGSMDFSPRQS
jgi:hypothetical protein